MNKQRIFSRTLLAIALAALGASGTALAIPEVEPNDDIRRPQQLQMGTGGMIEVEGSIGTVTGDPIVPDTDFYSFRANAGDIIDIDIDGGIGGLGHVDTLLTLFGPGPTFQWLTENDDVRRGDPGTISPSDARIDKFVIPATGVYTVAVTAAPVAFVQFGTGGTYRATTAESNGDYRLIISGVTAPAVKFISIDIKPGSTEIAPVNPKAKGTIPVALLSADGFDAVKDVKWDSLTFGANGNEPSLRRCGKGGEDVNGDGRLDLVCHFDNQVANFEAEDSEGIVKGMTTGGTPLEGHGFLKVVPVKRK